MARPTLHPRPLALSLLAALLGFAVQCGNAAEHTLIPQPGTVQIFNFDAATPPVLRIESGDIVNIETAGSLDPNDIDRTGAVPYGAVPEHIRSLFRLIKERGPHLLTGPVYVNGAMPGDVLEVRLLEIELAADYGFNIQRPYTGALPEEFTQPFLRVIPINRATKTAEVAPGVVVPANRGASQPKC